jgi:hypothetical protein
VDSLGKLHDGDTEIRKATCRRKVAVSDDVKIPTIAFYKSVEHYAGAKNPNQVATLFDSAWSTRASTTREWDTASSGKWKNYAKGTHKPQSAFVNDVDAIYPGTKAVLERGPYGVPLWDALWGPIQLDHLRELALPLPDLRRTFTLEEDLSFSFHEFSDAVISSGNLQSATEAEKALWILRAAILSYRWHAECRSPNILIWYRLLFACLSTPPTQAALSHAGICALVTRCIRVNQANFLKKHLGQFEWIIFHSLFSGLNNPIGCWLGTPCDFPIEFSVETAHLISLLSEFINQIMKGTRKDPLNASPLLNIQLSAMPSRHPKLFECNFTTADVAPVSDQIKTMLAPSTSANSLNFKSFEPLLLPAVHRLMATANTFLEQIVKDLANTKQAA